VNEQEQFSKQLLLEHVGTTSPQKKYNFTISLYFKAIHDILFFGSINVVKSIDSELDENYFCFVGFLLCVGSLEIRLQTTS